MRKFLSKRVILIIAGVILIACMSLVYKFTSEQVEDKDSGNDITMSSDSETSEVTDTEVQEVNSDEVTEDNGEKDTAVDKASGSEENSPSIPIYNGEPGNATPANSTEQNSNQPSQTNTSTNKSINTIYGSHTYGCRDQAEYDAVMEKAKEKANIGLNATIAPYIVRYADGDRAENYAQGSDEYNNLLFVHKTSGYMITKLPRDLVFKFIKVMSEATVLARSSNAKNPYDGSPRSAYDVLFVGVTDCDANAQVKSAVLDSAGFSTSVRYSNGHAWLVVNLGGTWWDCGGAPVGLTGNAVPNSSPN